MVASKGKYYLESMLTRRNLWILDGAFFDLATGFVCPFMPFWPAADFASPFTPFRPFMPFIPFMPFMPFVPLIPFWPGLTACPLVSAAITLSQHKVGRERCHFWDWLLRQRKPIDPEVEL